MIAGSKDEAVRRLVPYIQYRIQYAQQVDLFIASGLVHMFMLNSG